MGSWKLVHTFRVAASTFRMAPVISVRTRIMSAVPTSCSLRRTIYSDFLLGRRAKVSRITRSHIFLGNRLSAKDTNNPKSSLFLGICLQNLLCVEWYEFLEAQYE